MEARRKVEIYQLLESCHATDNSDLDSEKTAVMEELVAEVERLEAAGAGIGGQESQAASPKT